MTTKTRARKAATSKAVTVIDPKLFDRGRRLAIAVAQHPENAKAIEKMTGGAGLSKGATYASDKEMYATAQLTRLAEAEKIRAETKKVDPDFSTALYGTVAFGGKYEGNLYGKNAVSDLLLTKLGDAEAIGVNVVILNFSVDAGSWTAQAITDMLYYAGELLPESKRQQWENSKVLVRFIGGDTEEPMIVDLFETQDPNGQNEAVVSAQDRASAIDAEQGDHVVN